MIHRDLLLLAAVICLTAAASIVSVPLGITVAGMACGAAWWLLGDDS